MTIDVTLLPVKDWLMLMVKHHLQAKDIFRSYEGEQPVKMNIFMQSDVHTLMIVSLELHFCICCFSGCEMTELNI